MTIPGIVYVVDCCYVKLNLSSGAGRQHLVREPAGGRLLGEALGGAAGRLRTSARGLFSSPGHKLLGGVGRRMGSGVCRAAPKHDSARSCRPCRSKAPGSARAAPAPMGQGAEGGDSGCVPWDRETDVGLGSMGLGTQRLKLASILNFILSLVNKRLACAAACSPPVRRPPHTHGHACGTWPAVRRPDAAGRVLPAAHRGELRDAALRPGRKKHARKGSKKPWRGLLAWRCGALGAHSSGSLRPVPAWPAFVPLLSSTFRGDAAGGHAGGLCADAAADEVPPRQQQSSCKSSCFPPQFCCSSTCCSSDPFCCSLTC